MLIRLRANAPGRYYVTDKCTGCRTCADIAPGMFIYDANGFQAAVVRQPATAAEHAQCLEAMEDCCSWAIRDDGDAYLSGPLEIDDQATYELTIVKPSVLCWLNHDSWDLRSNVVLLVIHPSGTDLHGLQRSFWRFRREAVELLIESAIAPEFSTELEVTVDSSQLLPFAIFKPDSTGGIQWLQDYRRFAAPEELNDFQCASSPVLMLGRGVGIVAITFRPLPQRYDLDSESQSRKVTASVRLFRSGVVLADHDLTFTLDSMSTDENASISRELPHRLSDLLGRPDLSVVPTVTSDIVTCSVYAPSRVRQGEAFLVQVFLHLKRDEAKVKALASSYDDFATSRVSRLLDRSIEHGGRVTLCLAIHGAHIEPPTQTLTWQGMLDAVQFGVTMPEGHPNGRLIGTVTASKDGVPFGHLKFVITVTTERQEFAEAWPKLPAQRWKRYRHAFISYASSDRREVLKRVQMLPRVSIEFFQDLLTLDPGDRWAQELYRNIDKSDVFFLFWSTAAKESKWVMEEVRYALERKAGDEFADPEIVPVLIEGPPPVPPPPELKHLHFNDRFLYFM